MNIIVKNIPNSITCMNIAAGCVAVICAFRAGDPLWGLDGYSWASIFIGIAAVMDFMDGFAARLLGAYSDLGKELDSLCDGVSFGVAPAMMLFNYIQECAPENWMAWFSLLIPVAGVLRLAKFNIDTRQTTSFIGLPIPANAIFWIGFVALCRNSAEPMLNWYLLLPIILFESWLMVSPLKLFSLKFKSFGWKGNQFRWLLIATTVLLLVFMQVPGLMWVIVAYIFYGLLQNKD